MDNYFTITIKVKSTYKSQTATEVEIKDIINRRSPNIICLTTEAEKEVAETSAAVENLETETGENAALL